MRLLIISFALRNTQKNYESFFVALRGNVFQWWHFIPQTALVASVYTVDELASRLNEHIDTTMDSLIVAEIHPHTFQGWLPQEAWDWLTQVSNSIEPKPALPAALRPPPPQMR